MRELFYNEKFCKSESNWWDRESTFYFYIWTCNQPTA